MHVSPHLTQSVVLLLAAVLIVAIFRMVKVSPIIGYLTAGALIGPYGLRVISDTESTGGIAEFGILFLLFLSGIELSLERLRRMSKHVFGFGGGQMILTTLLFSFFFIGFGGEERTALIIGGGLAMSSTAIVLQVLAEQGEKSSQVGRLALAVLILQDLAVIPLLILVTLLADHSKSLSSLFMDVAFNASFGLLLIFIAGRLLLRPLFHFIASLENTPLFTATTLLVVLGMSWLTSVAGLSTALGAFMAGLLIAETEFRPQVEADILPFKELFMGLFFMSVGMSLDMDMLLYRFPSIIGLTIALMAAKSLVIMALCRIFRFPLNTAVHTGMLLSQGGEFTFVLFALAGGLGVVSPQLTQIMLVVVTVSMTLTPLAAQLGQRIAQALVKHAFAQPESMLDETLDLSQHVIISGYGRVGHTVARLLEKEHIGFAAIDMDSLLVARERKNGVPVYYGDTTRMHVLSALGITRARALIITHSDTRVAMQTIQAVRELNPSLPIIARARNIEQVQKLEAAGANLAVAEMFETSLQLGGATLRAVGIGEHEISRIIDLFRAADYALTRASEKEASL